jgi:L,D-transpeptidase ErfK/SrfK
VGEELPLPISKRDNVVGQLRYTLVGRGDSLLDIARAFDIGHDEMLLANPQLNRWVPKVGAEVLIPSLYVLPAGERKGIVLNLAELRLYFFQPGKQVVHTFPVSIGDYDWSTPQGTTRIISKQVNPPWYPPKSIREEHAEDGEELPPMVPGGDPDNPLGEFALKLAIPRYLIHGTDQRRASGIGMRVSHGCIRLYPEDMEKLFSMVPVGTPVRIIDQAVKAGLRDDHVFLEMHQALVEDGDISFERPSVDEVLEHLRPYQREGFDIEKDAVEETLRRSDGIPMAVTSQKGFEEEFWGDPYF